MVKIVPFHSEHLAMMELKDCHHGGTATGPSGPAITLMDGEYPVAIIGWFQICPGVLQVWGNFSERTRRVPLSLTKTAKKLLEFALKDHHRVQISVRCDYTEGYAWASTLGFTCEAIMQKYGMDQSDYYLFARVA
jgi:hypothetical protein